MIIIPTYSGTKTNPNDQGVWTRGARGMGFRVLGNQGVKISKVGKIPALEPVSILFLSDSNPI